MVSFSKYICSFLPEILLLVSSCNVLYVLVCTHFVITPFSEVEICREVFNVSEFHSDENFQLSNSYFKSPGSPKSFQEPPGSYKNFQGKIPELFSVINLKMKTNIFLKKIPKKIQDQFSFVQNLQRFPIQKQKVSQALERKVIIENSCNGVFLWNRN